MGREQLKRLPEMVARRREVAQRYRRLLTAVEGLELPLEPDWARSNWQSFCVRLPARCDQRRVMQAMLDDGVSTRRGIMCAHLEPAYAREPWSCGSGPGRCACPPGACRRLGHSERAQQTAITLPLYHQMTEDDQDEVVAALARACARSSGPTGGSISKAPLQAPVQAR